MKSDGCRAFSPQAWGCTVVLHFTQSPRNVFPTGVGVYRFGSMRSPTRLTSLFSPQAWGCTVKASNHHIQCRLIGLIDFSDHFQLQKNDTFLR